MMTRRERLSQGKVLYRTVQEVKNATFKIETVCTSEQVVHSDLRKDGIKTYNPRRKKLRLTHNCDTRDTDGTAVPHHTPLLHHLTLVDDNDLIIGIFLPFEIKVREKKHSKSKIKRWQRGSRSQSHRNIEKSVKLAYAPLDIITISE